MPHPRDHFISGDWGTSRLRLALVKREPFGIEETITTDDGIAAVHARWQQHGGDRESFYKTVLSRHLKGFRSPLDGVPIILSGMASSSIGLRELPYADIPRAITDSLLTDDLNLTDALPHPVTLVSGLRWGTRDVMRGEETQLVGLTASPSLELPDAYCLLLPGTHCKHVWVEQGIITRFHTFLTGDLFQALAGHTILQHSLAQLEPSIPCSAFREGVRRAQHEPLPQALFGIRCADLFGERDHVRNAQFLSGLLIGSELAAMNAMLDPVVISPDGLGLLYREALACLGNAPPVISISPQVMAEAVPRTHQLFATY